MWNTIPPLLMSQGRPCSTLPPAEPEKPAPILPEPLMPKPAEILRPEEATNPMNPIFDKPSFLQPKPISHSPKISPSSIPNPSPSVSTTKQIETGYPNYGGYLYSIPGYSAFQPINYPSIIPQQITTSENSDFTPYSSLPKRIEAKSPEDKTENQLNKEVPKPQTDFEEQFTPEIVPAVSIATPDSIKSLNENKMSITSLSQGSGATVTIPSQVTNKDPNKKKPERYSLKTSIPISKIDIKCVSNPPEAAMSTTVKKPTVFNPIYTKKVDSTAKVEIQSNIVIRSAPKEPEISEIKTPSTHSAINSINNLLSAAEVINKNDSQFRKPEPKADVINEIKDPPPNYNPVNVNVARPIINTPENSKANFPPKPPDGNFNEQKNQILFIQNKNQNPKMLLTIQQQNPQVLLQRANFESKNAQVPSRLSSQKKTKEEVVSENSASSKVVALKRLHQENCDENDFENLITENQIYGNKIVVKEKSQGTLQEQDLKTKNNKVEKPAQETKNVVLQPNFLYLSNVQFPGNLMMIKNNAKVNQATDQNKSNKVVPNENKATNEVSTMTNCNDINASKINKPQNVAVSKDIHVLKSSNNVLQTLSNKNSKTDVVFQSHPKVIVNSQIVYQVPMIVDSDNKINQQYISRDYPKFVAQNKKECNKVEPRVNDKLFIACPYQMDSKLQPKIVITNLRPKVNKLDEVSTLDIYEKRKRMRRLKYLLKTNPNKDGPKEKSETKKMPERIDSQKNIISPEKMQEEICKELANSRMTVDEGSSESESDYGEEDLAEYYSIIEKHKPKNENRDKKDSQKAEFLAHFRLGTHEFYKEKELDRHERSILKDSVAAAYIAVGRIDRLHKVAKDYNTPAPHHEDRVVLREERLEGCEEVVNGEALQRKQHFMSTLKLTQVTPQYKEGYERSWQEILKERKRRNGIVEPKQILKQPKLDNKNIELDPNDQLRILTEIKKSVNENNNLIKKRLDALDKEGKTEGDSIHTLAEKNFSELNRLSSLADRSVKLITGQDTRKRDLNPGFDSENIQKQTQQPNEQPFQNYQINIPHVSKIIALKTDATTQAMMTSQAISMDEPENSAAGVIEIKLLEPETKDFGCQVEEILPWPGVETFIKSYREYDAARKKEINDLHRRDSSLRVEAAHITRAASRDSDRARALLAERQLLATEELAVRRALKVLTAAVEVIRKYKS